MIAGKSSPYLARRAKKFKCVKKDYQHKNLHNPFFHKHQGKSSKNNKRKGYYFYLFFILLLFFILFYLFLFSNLFSLKEVKINGVSRIAENNLSDLVWRQVEEKRLGFLKQNNLLLFKTDELQAGLAADFSFDSVNIYKKWPHTVVVSVNERGLSFIWRDKESRFFSDSRGCLIKETSVLDENLAQYPVLTSISNQDYVNNKNCLSLDESYLSAVFTLYDKFKNYPDLSLREFLLDGAFNTLQVKLQNGPNILFNIKDDLDKQLNKLLVIKQEKGDDYFKSLEYIDLRYGDRAYFK